MVETDPGEGRDPTDARDLHDVPAALLAQERQASLGHPQGTEQVRLDLGASLLLADLLDRAEQAVAGVVDDDVEAAEVLVRAGDRLESGRTIGDVELECEHVLAIGLDELRERVRVAGRRRDPVAARERRLRPLATEAT